MRLTAFRNAKGRKSQAKRPCFAMQNTAFYNITDYQAFTRASAGAGVKPAKQAQVHSQNTDATSPKSTKITSPMVKSFSTVTPHASPGPLRWITLSLTLQL